MIVTVTPSPSIDWTVTVDAFDFDSVNRATSTVREPSGKGVNVSWALKRAGVPTRAIFPAGGATGEFMADALTRGGVDHSLVESGVDVRTNITLIAPQTPGTKINEPGVRLNDQVIGALLDEVQRASGKAAGVLCCGSLPHGAPATLHRDLALRARRGGSSFIAVDASGEALERALEAHPDLVKPNVHELADLTGCDIRTLGQVIEAAERARSLGAGAVLASLGGDGVLLVDDAGALYGRATGIPVVNSVGAGDALLAGFMAGGPDRTERLRTAVLWASSAVACPTTLFPVRTEFLEGIQVTGAPDLGLLLREPSLGLVPVHP